VVIFTVYDYEGLDRAVLAAGCDGYVIKSRASSELVEAVKAVLAGRQFYSGLENKARGHELEPLRLKQVNPTRPPLLLCGCRIHRARTLEGR
jgi:DNA-binding NarL/FixJ family response regulator